MSEPIRWIATIYYRTDNGTVDVEHQLSEIDELHDLVERGPHWDCVVEIRITRANHVTSDKLTVEQAAQL
jgi:hypothetical protein